ncbi:hypothetical protein H0H81_005477 [Sphagnurus paluster]|uniref:Uncharacterized protein n=1 Tax=Sphagnurus paluster TaxID=117069 RepID=A0A9P7FS68_9AGAR|nr:hypothetical protein H0H81_005477 [Sphagnurus paluster]
MGEGIQITIPDFDDDEFSSAPTPFGRSATTPFGFGGGFGSAGQDSPVVTPIADRGERSFFPSHSRVDSVASEDSTHSGTTRYISKSFHSSQTSITAVSTGSAFTKKPSFASIRNAFKSGKNNDPPPLPPLDQHAYPVLKNPFNRSTSSLNQSQNTPRGPSNATSPPFQRPPTPGSSARTNRGKQHTPGKSNHSQTGSIFHYSDGSSDHGHYSSSPPPVPRVPMPFGQMSRSDTPPVLDFDDEKVVVDPKTPSDYALHAVFMRFATSAENKIETFLQQGLDQEPTLLKDLIGPGVDPKFDEILQSLGKIAQRHAKPVLDSIMRWRRSQHENVGSDIIRHHAAQSPTSLRSRQNDIPALLYERKSLVAIYIMCRALIAVMQSISKDALGEAMGYTLEETTFEQFRKPDLKLLTQSANHRTNADLYATLLGHIANVRFTSVTDRFLAELGPVAQGQVPKDLDMKYENLVRGLMHIQIKVWPPESFEEGAEFLESLSKSFAQAHGLRLKTTAQAETNNPQWAKAIEIIYPKAREMMAKPRYWSVAFPLAITSMCVAPQNYFLKNWVACFEAACSKLKEKPLRMVILNGVMRLIWTYLYRCQESASTTTTKLDSLLKNFFPTNRLAIVPAEDRLVPFVYIVHFILSRHFEFGKDLCFDLLQESSLQQSGNIGNVLAPEKINLAVQAILLSLHAIEKDTPIPTWPSSTDFSIAPLRSDYPTSSEFIPASLLSKSGMKDFVDRVGSAIAAIATHCYSHIGHMSVFDEQWAYARLNLPYEEAHNFAVRRHSDGYTVAYPNNLIPHVQMLQTCFQSWPRCLHPTIPLEGALDMILRGMIHVDPLLADISCLALKRFMADRGYALTVLSRFTKFLFSPTRISKEGTGVRLLVESSQVLELWSELVDGWIRELLKQKVDTIPEDEDDSILERCGEIEGAALFLLTHEDQSIHASGVKVIRTLGLLAEHIAPLQNSATYMQIVGYIHGKGIEKTYLQGYDELLEGPELLRLEQWRESKRVDIPLRIADSTNERDRKLWHFVYPAFLQACIDLEARLGLLRDSVMASVLRYHPTILQLAGISTKVPAANRTPLAENSPRVSKPIVDQWRIWVKVLCATAIVSESHRPTNIGREHTRAPSDVSFNRERLSTTRGLFRYLAPFLDSEHTRFRDAAVVCISTFPSNAYPQLLEDLSLLAGRQFNDDPRAKAGVTPIIDQGILSNQQFYNEARSKPWSSLLSERTRRQERLHSAVARIYYLTAHFLQLQRSAGRQAALANVLKFVRNTQTFLTATEMRDNFTLQRLRRYFCGTVERLFDGLATLKDSDRFIPSNMHLTLYRLCEEWCQLGPQTDSIKQRLILMQRAAASSVTQSESSIAVERFKNETTMLSQAAVGALASLCVRFQKAFFPPDMSSGSPTERLAPPEYMKPLTPTVILERLSGILSSSHPPTQARGKKALRSILSFNATDKRLLEESLRRAVVLTGQLDTCNGRFFEIISDIVCSNPSHGFTFAQVVCLGLSNLRHPLLTTRRHAFNMLEAIHQQSAGLLPLWNFEATVGSCASGTYVHAHRMISDSLAGEHPHQAVNILAQFATWLPQLPEIASSTNVTILILQSLEFWIPNIELMPEDRSGWSPGALSALYHLVSLTLRYGQSHSEQVLVIWTKLVESPHPANGHATIRFLLEHSHKVGSATYVECAANIVACLCQTSISQQIFQELCSVIEPARMLPTIEHKLTFPDARDMELWEELDALFTGEPRLSLGSAQFAWLFLTDVAMQRSWELKEELPTLLHALFTHLDHRAPFVRQRAHRMLFQCLRSWVPGYDEVVERSSNPGRVNIKSAIDQLEKDAEGLYWKEDELSAESEPKMKTLSCHVLGHLIPLHKTLVDDWGSLALNWGTTCSIRGTAFRSLQIHRALMPRVGKRDLAVLLGRLSNTISAADENLQSFTSEILQTLTALTTVGDIDWTLLPQVFWCTCASLSTTIREEFSQVLILLESLLTKIDLDDHDTVELLISRRPSDWQGPASLQPALLKGLRSSNTSATTFKILQILSAVRDDRLIDPSGGRVRDLYTLSLPWCLHAMSSDKPDDSLKEFAENIGILANAEGKQSIQKIMNSFAKSHFRTRDDFLRQSVASLREHYGADHWAEIVTLLLGLVLNRERWLQMQTMQILKVLFQQRETRNPFELLGSELLMPLLCLLETDLATNALDVLEEPMTMSGGLAAKHVLRMSTRILPQPFTDKDPNSVATVFGIPDESGWSIAQADQLRETCRANLMTVFDTCSMASRPSRIDFEPEVEALASLELTENDLGGLVKDLHELTSFFEDDQPSRLTTPLPAPNRRLEARVAAILAKSTALDTVSDMPQTPFLDVFKIGGMSDGSDDSDDYSDTDSEVDAFIFDSPDPYRRAPNGFKSH